MTHPPGSPGEPGGGSDGTTGPGRVEVRTGPPDGGGDQMPTPGPKPKPQGS